MDTFWKCRDILLELTRHSCDGVHSVARREQFSSDFDLQIEDGIDQELFVRI